ncbi:TadE/TadG family type IV pilus assembly protein [Streptomyces xiamenensis]|uniref:TadE/TadG family type IV pilus assembly protein n=1 Tax=Streptomyces xiamenensis TaxID=408015 RepID=UPI0035DD08A1
MRALRRTGGRDRGSYTLETVIIAPCLFLLAGMIVAWGMAGRADGAVDRAAQAAARAASMAETAEQAQQDGRRAAMAVLDSHARECTGASVSVDTSGFSLPVGEPAAVTATVSCTVPLSEVTVPGVPGSRSLSGEFVSALDVYATRQ